MEETTSLPSSSSPSEAEGKHDISIAKKSIIEEAREAANELRQQIGEKKAILAKEEELISRREALNQMGGSSPAGSRPETHVETPTEYKNRILKG